MIPMFIGGFILLLLFWLGTKALLEYGTIEENYDLQRAAERTEVRDRVLAEAATLLNEYAWIDQEQGLVQLPVSRAMELTVKALSLNNPIEPAGFVDPLKALAEDQGQATDATTNPTDPVEPADPVETPTETPANP